MVVDSSIFLAILFAEPHAEWAARHLQAHASELRMSTVNLAEILIRLRDRQPRMFEELESRVLASGIRFVPPDVRQARIVAEARIRYPLNLGDCSAYALASVEACPILTTDKDFRSVDLPVLYPEP